MLGRLGEAVRVGHGVLSVAEELRDLECVVPLGTTLGYVHALRGDFTTSRTMFDVSATALEQMENPSRWSFLFAQRAWLAILVGDWPAAQTELDQARVWSRGADRSWYSAYPLILLARLRLLEGEAQTAAELARDAVAQSEAGGDLQGQRWAVSILAEIDILAGRPEVARARLVPLLDRPGLEECDVTSLLVVLAWAYLELGQANQAAASVDQALTRARREDMRVVVVEALRVRSLVAVRRAEWDVAVRCLEEGLTLARDMPYPYAEARLLQVFGELDARTGDVHAARRRLEAARITLQRIGANAECERAEQQLAALSVRPSMRVPDGPGRL
jgi:ATP/maltotriose-dependent transcriptional regulator MalT